MRLKNKVLWMVLFILLFVTGCYRSPMGGSMGSWDHMMGYGTNGGVVMWILLIVVIGVVFYVIFDRNKQGGFRIGSSEDSPMEILKKRYAKGEIQKEEFERMKKELEE